VTIHLINPFGGDALTACGESAAIPGNLRAHMDDGVNCKACRRALVAKFICPSCEEPRLSWGTHPRNKSGVSDGRLTMNDVETIFYLACDYCSATVLTRVDPDDVAAALTEMGWTPQ
jgi:hypothetical protein